MYESSGILVVDPPSGRNGPPKPWWIMLKIDDDLRRYYAWFIRRVKKECVLAPAWHAHISVVRGECPPLRGNWRNLNGRQVSFTYDGDIKSNGIRWYMPVYSPELEQVRRDLGLSPQPRQEFHLSIGLVTDWKDEPWTLCIDDGNMSHQPVDTRRR